MKLIILTLSLVASIQVFANSINKEEGSFLTTEAGTAILNYIGQNCSSIVKLEENTTAIYKSGDLEENKLGYLLASYIDIYSDKSGQFDRVEISVHELRATENQAWSAKVIGFDGAPEFCKNL